MIALILAATLIALPAHHGNPCPTPTPSASPTATPTPTPTSTPAETPTPSPSAVTLPSPSTSSSPTSTGTLPAAPPKPATVTAVPSLPETGGTVNWPLLLLGGLTALLGVAVYVAARWRRDDELDEAPAPDLTADERATVVGFGIHDADVLADLNDGLGSDGVLS